MLISMMRTCCGKNIALMKRAQQPGWHQKDSNSTVDNDAMFTKYHQIGRALGMTIWSGFCSRFLVNKAESRKMAN